KDIAASGKQRALTFRAQPNCLDQIRGRYATRPAPIAFRRNVDRNRRALLRACIHHHELAVHFVNDLAFVVGTGPTYVPRSAGGDLRGPAARHVVSVEIEVTVAIRVVEDVVANPHRITRGARAFGAALRGVAAQIEDVKLIGLAAAVTLFRAEVARLWRVNDLIVVRRVV